MAHRYLRFNTAVYGSQVSAPARAWLFMDTSQAQQPTAVAGDLKLLR